VIFCKVRVWRRSVIPFCTLSTFQPFFKDFQHILILKLLITLKDLQQRNDQVFLIWISHCFHFRAGNRSFIGNDGTVFSFLWRNAAVEMIDWMLVDCSKIFREWCRFQLLRETWRLFVWDFPGFSMIFCNKLSNDVKDFGQQG